MSETITKEEREHSLQHEIDEICHFDITEPITLLPEKQLEALIKKVREQSGGIEMNLAVLFCDMRRFVNIVEDNPPQQVLSMLTSCHHKVGEAIVGNGGYINDYAGDGIMAVFGLYEFENSTAASHIVRRALNAAAQMLNGIKEVDGEVSASLGIHIQVGIGVAYGKALVAEVGHSSHRKLTVLGDVVNLASRIESIAKEKGAQLLVSNEVIENAQTEVQIVHSFETMIKGKSDKLKLHSILVT